MFVPRGITPFCPSRFHYEHGDILARRVAGIPTARREGGTWHVAHTQPGGSCGDRRGGAPGRRRRRKHGGGGHGLLRGAPRCRLLSTSRWAPLPPPHRPMPPPFPTPPLCPPPHALTLTPLIHTTTLIHLLYSNSTPLSISLCLTLFWTYSALHPVLES